MSLAAPAPSHIVSGQWLAADGLPVDTVTSLAVDDKGALWLGTHDGLARFDGFGFSHFNADSKPAMPGNRLSRVISVPGRLVIGFENGDFGTFSKQGGYQGIGRTSRENLRVDQDGLWYAQGERLMRWEPGTGARQIAAFDSLELIHPDPAGDRLFVATDRSDVIAYYPADNRSRRLIDALEGPALALANNPQGQLGVLTPSGLELIDLNGRNGSQTIPIPQVQWDRRRMSWTAEGWLTTMNGTPPFGRLMRIDQRGVVPIESAPYDFHHFVLTRTDARGQQWINHGTRLYRDGELVHVGEHPINDFVFDRYGQVWLATSRGGLKRLTEPVMYSACRQGDCLDDPNTYLVTEHGDGLLIGNQFALYHHDPAAATWERLMWFLPLGAVVDGEDLLIGGSGLCRLQSDGSCAGGQPEPQLEIRLLMRDRGDAIWMGSDRGLYRRAADGQWSDQPLSAAFVRTAVNIDNQHLAFGTMSDGVLMASIDSPQEPLSVIADSGNGLASNSVRSLHALADHRLLVGLEDRDMCLLDPGQGVERCISVADGLPHHSVHRMIKDDYGRLWVNTNNGIYAVYIEHLIDFFEGRAENLTTRRFDSRDGMPGNEGNGNLHQAGTRTADGRIWFPNQHGVVVIHPDRLQAMEHLLRANITPLGHSEGEQLRLPPEARLLRTRLEATALRGKDAVQFRYRLGEQAAWHFVGNQTELAFESLSPGSYRLQVQARYHDGQWPAEATTLAFEVPPRLTERGGYWLILGLGGLLLLAGLFWREHTQVVRLERTVDQRTTDLRQALTTVKAQASSIRSTANRRHQLFLAISHELRTQLTLVLGPLRDQNEPPDSAQLKRMRRSAEQMQSLIDQILELEQLGYIRSDETRPVSLSPLLERVMETASPAAEEKSVRIQKRIHALDDPPWLQADSVRLERALAIVLDNAIKFSPRGGSVRLGLDRPVYGRHVTIVIEDSGPGIAPDRREVLFEPFVRGDTDRPGLGLGLALCRRIVEQHSGTITIGDSDLGGASFTLEFPLVDKPDETPVLPASGATKILVVDDNAGIRAHITEILDGRYQVLQAQSGTEGEKLASSERPDLIVVDAQMPEMDGFELLQRLRERDETATTPVILCTAHGHRETEARAFRAGADHYLEKPFSAEQLLIRIERLLSRTLPEQRSGTQSGAESEKPSSAAVITSTFMTRLDQVLTEQLENPELDIDDVAALVGTSRASLYRRLETLSQTTPAEYIRNFRLRRAAEMLRQSDTRIAQIAFAVGFRRQSAFTRAFKAHYQCTPSEYRSADKDAKA